MIVLLERRAERRHDPVSHVGDQRATCGEDRLGHLVEVVVDDRDHLLHRLVLREPREPSQVAEHHRADALDGGQAQVVVGAREDLVDDAGRHEPRERRARVLALERLPEVDDRECADDPDNERELWVDHGDDPTRVERQLRRERVERTDDDTAEQRSQGPTTQTRTAARRSRAR